MSFLTEAILALRPGAQFSTNGDIIIWHDTEQDQPSDSDIAAKQSELQADYDSKAYARARATAYPSVSDFMEAYTEKEIGGSSTKWDAYVTAYNKVRTDNPKP
jgi:hypothetical protein